MPAVAGLFFCAFVVSLKQAWGNSLTQKSQRQRWLFACAERPRFELGDQKNRSQLSRLLHYHSATSPRFVRFLSRACDLREGKNSEILSPTTRQVEGVCILAIRDGVWPSLRSQKLNNTMKKFLFLGAFAIFALTASAQSTEAPADKKAKTEQTCSKDANKATCSKDANKATCSKDQKASCDKSKSAGCCSKGAAADAGDKKPQKSKKRGGNKTSGLSSGH